MSAESRKKVATATRQAKHALANVEDAAELEVEEVVDRVMESKPARVIEANKVAVIAGVAFVAGSAFGGAVVAPLVQDKLAARKLKKAGRKARKAAKDGVENVEDLVEKEKDRIRKVGHIVRHKASDTTVRLTPKEFHRFQHDVGKATTSRQDELGRDLTDDERDEIIDELAAAEIAKKGADHTTP